MLILESLQVSSEQLWEPKATPRSAQGASRLNPKLSVSRVVGGLTAVPGPVEGKGEVNSPEMQVGTGLISARHVSVGYGGLKGLRPAADPELGARPQRSPYRKLLGTLGLYG